MKKHKKRSRTKSKSKPKPTPTPEETLYELTKRLNVIMLYRNQCGNCIALKREASEQGISSLVNMIDVDSKEGSDKLGTIILPQGSIMLPIYTSLLTNKVHTGYESIDTVIKSLE